MEEFLYQGKTFYLVRELVDNKHPCVKGMAGKPLDFFKRKNLSWEKHYLFVRKHATKPVWVSVKPSKYARKVDKIIISEEWVNQFAQLKTAPEILELEDYELFRDDEGESYKIEVRGIRKYDKCYFKAKDVGSCFNIITLTETLSDNRGGYVEGEDYVRFLVTNEDTQIKNAEIYLTYVGLIRVMMVSRVGNAKRFLKNVMQNQFTFQFGTREQKSKLSSKLTGIDYETVKAFCTTLHASISAIYLFKLGKVKDLKDTLSIPDTFDLNANVYKYGKTNDIQRRFREHLSRNYSKDKGYDTKLELIWFVDRARYTEAENEVKEYMIQNGYKLDHSKHNEIAIINETKANVAKMMNPIFCEYSSQINNLEAKIAELLMEIKLLQKDNENKDLTIELLKREKELSDTKLELALLKKA